MSESTACLKDYNRRSLDSFHCLERVALFTQGLVHVPPSHRYQSGIYRIQLFQTVSLKHKTPLLINHEEDRTKHSGSQLLSFRMWKRIRFLVATRSSTNFHFHSEDLETALTHWEKEPRSGIFTKLAIILTVAGAGALGKSRACQPSV